MNQQMLVPRRDANNNPTLALPSGDEIEFRDGQLLLRYTNEAGCLSERLISWQSARAAFTNVPVDSGWLPAEVRRRGEHNGTEWGVAYVAPHSRTLEITDEAAPAGEGARPGPAKLERVTVPLPGHAVFGIATNFYVWAVKGDSLDPHREIFRAPLPNLYASGEICWGLLKPPRASRQGVVQAWELFARTTFNNHLASGRSRRHADDVRTLLRELAAAGDGAAFPEDDLVRHTEAGLSLDKAIRLFFETGEMPE